MIDYPILFQFIKIEDVDSLRIEFNTCLIVWYTCIAVYLVGHDLIDIQVLV